MAAGVLLLLLLNQTNVAVAQGPNFQDAVVQEVDGEVINKEVVDPPTA